MVPMLHHLAHVLVVFTSIACLSIASARADFIAADQSIITDFTISVNFDLDPAGFAIGDDVDILDQYADIGVRFRNQLSPFAAPLGGFPGETDDDESVSLPNALEADDDVVFVLFETPILAAGAFVLGDDEEGIFLSGYDSDLNLVGTVGVPIDDDERFEFLGFTTDIPIAVIAFRIMDGDDFLIDNLGITPVPVPGTGLLTLVGVATLYRLRRRS